MVGRRVGSLSDWRREVSQMLENGGVEDDSDSLIVRCNAFLAAAAAAGTAAAEGAAVAAAAATAALPAESVVEEAPSVVNENPAWKDLMDAINHAVETQVPLLSRRLAAQSSEETQVLRQQLQAAIEERDAHAREVASLKAEMQRQLDVLKKYIVTYYN